MVRIDIKTTLVNTRIIIHLEMYVADKPIFNLARIIFKEITLHREAETSEITDTQDIELEITNKIMPLIVHNTIILTMDHMDQETIILIQIRLTNQHKAIRLSLIHI